MPCWSWVFNMSVRTYNTVAYNSFKSNFSLLAQDDWSVVNANIRTIQDMDN